jgi:hypothetical protein
MASLAIDDMKLNVDVGQSRHGGKGATTVVCRDASGKFVGASATVFDGLADLASLEAHGCNELYVCMLLYSWVTISSYTVG